MQSWRRPRPSKGEQVMHECPALPFGEGRPVLVAGVAVTLEPGVIAEAWAGIVLRPAWRSGVTALHEIDQLQAAHERGLALIGRLKQVIQGGNRAIVEVGPREPDAVERLGEVAVELLELVEGPREAPAVAVLVLPVLVVVVVGGGRLL